MIFEKIFTGSELLLTEAALVERLKSEFHLKMDPHINHAGLIYTHPEVLEFLYRQYISIGQKHDLPVMIMTPTRKVNEESAGRSAFRYQKILQDASRLLNRIREDAGEYSGRIMIGGLLGCRGDAYSGKKELDAEEAFRFHQRQTMQFIPENIDYLFAGIMPEINESIGMARAMAETGLPYIISFMLRKEGCLPDGTYLCDAIQMIDKQLDPPPLCYMTNCIHPSNLIKAMSHEYNANRPELSRFMGIQANASDLSPEALNNCQVLQQGDFYRMAEEMHFLRKKYNLKIFGGCCGTNDTFLKMLSKKLTETA